jgi:CheY-like chemotaxis protein
VSQPIADKFSALQGLRVLMVDDDMVDDDGDCCELVSALFSLYGADMTTCSSVQAALERFALLQPQMLLSDIAMPLQDGYVLIQSIARSAKNRVGKFQPLP